VLFRSIHATLWEFILQQEEVVPLSGPLEGLGEASYSTLGTRLVIQDELTGILLAVDREERVWRSVDRQLLNRLTQEALLAYARANAFLKLQQLSLQLKELNSYRNNMVSIASHEMRTPLASISLFVETLLVDRELISDEELGQMQAECTRMTNLLNNLTTLVNLEANATQFNYQPIVLPPLLNRLHKRIAPLVDRYPTVVTIQDHSHGLIFVSDEQKVESVLYSLLENACKHTPTDSQVTLLVATNGTEMKFSIADNGQGIPTEKLPTLFEVFIRVEDVMHHSKGGAGLGLAITKETVDKLGGRIEVQSVVGQGTTFTVILPVQRTE